MKKQQIIVLLLIFSVKSLFAQNSNCNVKNGFAIDGYDVVAYFENG